jgi:hypothetical protein
MAEPVRCPEPLLIALAHQRGFALDEAEAAALRPRVESLLTRLARLGEALGGDVAPAPTSASRFRG